MPINKLGQPYIQNDYDDDPENRFGVSLVYIADKYVRQDGSSTMCGDLKMGGNTIKNIRLPTNPEEAATKEYVDSSNPFEFRNGGFIAKDKIYFGGNKIGGVRMPRNKNELASKEYVDTEIAKVKVKEDENGGTIDAKNHRFINLKEPEEEKDAATKEYGDD